MRNLLICLVLGMAGTALGCGSSDEEAEVVVVEEDDTVGDEMYAPDDVDEVSVETDDGEVEEVETDY